MFQMEEFDPLGQDSNSSNFQQMSDHHKRKPKPNTKNTYIKKISSLIKISNQDQVDEKLEAINAQNNEKRQFCGRVQSQQFVEKEDKLAKNRESARNSRKRKKIYLELLENKVTKLSEQLESFKNVYDRNQDLALSLQNKINQKRDQDHTKAILFANLQNTTQGNTSENNVDSIIDSLNKKFGSGSIERHQLIDHYARQIYENCLSPYMNYILGVAKSGQDIFSQHDDQGDMQILRKLKLTDKQKQIILKKQQKLIRHYEELTSTLSSVQEVKNYIQTELSQLDQTLEHLRKELKPSQVARFLLAIEKKDMQHQFKESFEKCFGSDIEEDDSLDLYQFMSEHNQCNSLGIDIQNTYEIYRASNDFLNGKYDVEDIPSSAKIE